MSGDVVVSLNGVRKIYGEGESAVQALDDVTISFGRRSFSAIMGPSGSGKSTLLQCAAGLDVPSAGSIEVAGTEIVGLSETALTLLRRERIGFVFQSYNLLGALTAAQNVELPLRLAGRRPSAAEVEAALASVGLDGRGARRPGALSGGQQQRVAIARALLTRPEVLFADEPTGALDSESGRTVLRLLRDLVDDHGHAIVMVTHDPVAASHADRVIFLADGRIVDEMEKPTAQAIAERMTGFEQAAITP